jgi:cell division protein FtsZ
LKSLIKDSLNDTKAKKTEMPEVPNSTLEKTNQHLIELMQQSRTKIFVIGAGGAGNNTITRLGEIGIEGAETLSINTDAQDLFFCKSNDKILIGEETCGGLGAGGIPDVGEASAEESEEEIKSKIEGADMVFVTCGLGGGTGTGSAPVISRIAQKAGALTIAVVTMPFSAEGIRRRENAERGLEKLQEAADTVLVIPNDKLLEVAPSLPINKAFMVSDELLGRAVKGITELITKPGLVSLDFADIKSVMKDSGMAMIGMGESDTGDRAIESVQEALNSPLLDLDISNAKSALVNISGSNDLTLNEAEKIVQIVADELDPEANIIWGTQIQEDLASTVRTTIVVAGVNSPSILGGDDGFNETSMGDESSSSPENDLEGFIDDVF